MIEAGCHCGAVRVRKLDGASSWSAEFSEEG